MNLLYLCRILNEKRLFFDVFSYHVTIVQKAGVAKLSDCLLSLLRLRHLKSMGLFNLAIDRPGDLEDSAIKSLWTVIPRKSENMSHVV
jgi:hypothetical protein